VARCAIHNAANIGGAEKARVGSRKFPGRRTAATALFGRMTATYNRAVTSRPLSLDTSPEIERLQIEGWRRMSPADKAGLVRALTVATIEMTKAGIRHRHPDESAEQHRMRLAEILLGLISRAVPSLAPADRPSRPMQCSRWRTLPRCDDDKGG
jgi:hypothetical protein